MSDRSVRLNELVARLPASTQVSGDTNVSVNAIDIDSRRVRSGALFVAVRGERADGHAFVAQAIANGAAAVVVEAAHALDVPANVSVVHVPNTRRALATIAARFYDDPSHVLDTIGVTGTNGKTTTTRMLAAILDAAQRPCGVIGTIGAEFGERHWNLDNTTPLPPELQAILAEMRDAGARAVAMEVSSHALALDRVEEIRFRVGILTNITRDHLDFHGSFEAYAAAKHRLFTMVEAAVFNRDDEHAARFAHEFASRMHVLTYSLRADADLVARDLDVTASGSTFILDGMRFTLAMPGRFNVGNALAAIAAARLLGIDDATSARGLASLARVRGRMEHVRGGDVDVVVDYAHTPDALDHALRALRETTTHTLAVVFGCGGDRDRGKRAEMGRVAAQLADRVYVTSDNPRSEEPQAIVDEIVRGIETKTPVIELDRRAAIERAVREAAPGDVVLIAGKGHETYQILGEQTIAFDDAAVAREALSHREARA